MSIQLDNNIIEKYHSEGYVVLDNFLEKNYIKKIRNELKSIIYDQAKKFRVPLKEENSLEENIKLIFLTDFSARKFIYDLVRNLTSIKKIQYSNELIEILKLFGLKSPIGLDMPTIRFDISLESERKYLTLPHQDLRSIRSSRCATIWIPITKVNKNLGTMKIWPGTFKKGLLKHDINKGQIFVDCLDLSKFYSILLSANPGDLIINNSFNIHSSHPGFDGSIKINAQFMMNDSLGMEMGDKYFNCIKIPAFKETY